MQETIFSREIWLRRQTAQNLNSAQVKQEAAAHKKEMEKKNAQEMAKQLENKGVVIKAKCGSTGSTVRSDYQCGNCRGIKSADRSGTG